MTHPRADEYAASGSGFTLIEISIVLVIIGLLVGGILVGRDLIHAAEIRATIRQYQSFNTAANTFRAKYNCLAGDCANASQFGLDVGAGDGDGDGTIGAANGSMDNISLLEVTYFWLHLSNAGLRSNEPLFNVTFVMGPRPSLKGGGNPVYGADIVWLVFPWYSEFTGAGYAHITGSHIFWITSNVGSNGGDGSVVYHPQDVFALDRKLDDGQPLTGILRAMQDTQDSPYGPIQAEPVAGRDNCVTSDTTPPSYGVTANTDTLCGVIIKAMF